MEKLPGQAGVSAIGQVNHRAPRLLPGTLGISGRRCTGSEQDPNHQEIKAKQKARQAFPGRKAALHSDTASRRAEGARLACPCCPREAKASNAAKREHMRARALQAGPQTQELQEVSATAASQWREAVSAGTRTAGRALTAVQK